MGEGFGRVDRIAKELAGRPAPVRRSTATRWAILGLLAVLGVAGAGFYVGLSGKRKQIPVPGVTVPSAEPPAAPTAPQPSAGGDRALLVAQIEVVLDDIDANLHALRLEWPGRRSLVVRWTWPDWMPLDRMDRELAELEARLGTETDPLATATRAWIAMARIDGPRLHELVGMWNEPDASIDAIAAEVRPMFDRMVLASQAVYAAVAVELRPVAHGTLAALAASCRVAPMLARLPDVTSDEMYGVSLACLDEARAFLAAHAGDRVDDHVAHQLGLATLTANDLLVEMARRHDAANGDAGGSSTSTLAHASTDLAAERRQLDPSLRPVPAEAPPP
jgi:uncharacterized protein (DUF1810 family)